MSHGAEFDVDQLFAPLSWNEFYEKHFVAGWPFIRRGSLVPFSAVTGLPSLANANSLCASLRKGLTLFGPDGFQASLSNPKEALPFYGDGYTLYCTDVEESISELKSLLDEVRYSFGCAAGSVEAFCSRPNAGASMHYDFDVNFQLLLRGRKKWKIAPNPLYANPLTSHSARNPESINFGADAALVEKRSFPRTMPDDSMEFVAEPGTVVFLPRGFWHETLALDETVAVNFVLKQSTWARVAAELIFNKLVEDPKWRAFSIGALGTEADDEAIESLELENTRELLKSLRVAVESLTPEQMLVSSASKSYVWTTGTRQRLTETDERATLVVNFDDQTKPKIEIGLDGPTVAFVRSLLNRARPFKPHQVVHELRDAPPHMVPHLLEQLVDAGVMTSA